MCVCVCALHELSQFQSAFDGVYFAVFTMATVGYGATPVTAAGKVVAALTGFAGVVLLAIPISIIRFVVDVYNSTTISWSPPRGGWLGAQPSLKPRCWGRFL
jgi:hypothetical protein